MGIREMLGIGEKPSDRPRVGVPWRTVGEESANKRERIESYLRAVRDAGGEPVPISLRLPDEELRQLAASLDAVVLTGSPADVDPQRFGSTRHPATNAPDPDRERTDDALLREALAKGKPVLAICYGAQLLNVHLGGSLLQDIPTEVRTSVDHDQDEDGNDGLHAVKIEGGSLAQLVQEIDKSGGKREVRINSSHHQSVLQPGKGLRITARSPDGVVEAVEYDGGPGWILGVQWHPERMRGDALAEALFRRLVTEARESARSQHGRPATS